VLGADFADSWQLPGGDLIELTAALGGRWGRDGGENLLASAGGRYYRRDFGRHLLFVRLDTSAGSELDLDAPLYLGGDSGLRGYPLRYQLGDRRWLLTVEQRFFTDWHLLRLARVGAVAFADVGRAWYAGNAGPGDPGAGVLADLGVGLRLDLSHSGSGTVIHLDVAVPLDGDSSISGVQWLVSSHKSF
jgi:hemolysin activation/secretion protein